MDWQSSLRALDKRLAHGEISMPDYRKLRDEILAEASSGSVKSRADRVPIPGSAARDTPSGEMTQVISADDEQTTVIPAEQVDQAADPDVTQVLGAGAIRPTAQTQPPPGGGPQPIHPLTMPPPTPPPGFPRPGQGGWTPVQGDEVFASAKPRRDSSPLLVMLALLGVLVLIGAGVWWFAFRGEQTAAPATPPSSAAPSAGTPTSAQPAPGPPTADEVAAQLPELSGTPNPDNATMSIDQALALKLFSGSEAELFRAQGATDVVFRAATDNGVGIAVLVVPTAGTQNGVAVTTGVHKHLTKIGFTERQLDLPGQPFVVVKQNQQNRFFGTLYTSGSLCVQVSSSQPLDGAETAIVGELTKVLDAVTTALPPS